MSSRDVEPKNCECSCARLSEIAPWLNEEQDDMSRTEELSTKIRTLSYDHERLQSMYRSATEKAANAERETNLHKSRLA